MTDAGVVQLDGVAVPYRSQGTGPTIVFVHGVYVDGSLWDDVINQLPGYRCIAPTWPLGAHPDPAPQADLTARATARRIPAFLDSLDLDDVTLVGNDTGGGLCLAALGTGHPGLHRIGGLVLTNCDSYEHFPPKGFDRLAGLSRDLPPLGAAILWALTTRPGRRAFLKSVCAQPPRDGSANHIFGAFATSRATRRDALRTTQSLEPSVTLDAVDALRAFTPPVLVAWGDSDKLFPMAHGERLAADFPTAQLVPVSGSSTYVMLDQPARLAELIAAFVDDRSG